MFATESWTGILLVVHLMAPRANFLGEGVLAE